jgi:heme-degrading monooxygenase HmoA
MFFRVKIEPTKPFTHRGTRMILEVAILNIIPGREAEFEAAFALASNIIAASPGYVSHQLQRCLEKRAQYILLVNWQTLEHHTQGFRGSPAYQEWRRLLHHFYDPFPTVEHYEMTLPKP